MRKVLLVLALVALVAMPAFASVQNLKVSGSINSAYLSRTNFDFGSTANVSGDLDQNFAFTSAKVRFDADLTDNVATTLELINERVWGNNSTAGDGVDVNLAYVTLKEMLYSPLTVVVGRQAFAYGNSLILSTAANADSTFPAIDLSAQTGMDAVRAILDYDPLTIELVAVKDVERSSSAASQNGNDANSDTSLFGINATYEFGDSMNSMVEGYLFAKIDKSTDAGVGEKTDKIYTPGVRVSVNPIESLNIQAEYAHQYGTDAGVSDNRTRNANAAQFLASYKIPAMQKYAPVAKYAFTYVSGDSNSAVGSDKNQAWDPLYEHQGFLAGYSRIYNSLFSLSNMFINEVTLEAKPIEDVTATLGWSGLWLDDEFDATGATYNADESFLGNEFDGVLAYAYTEDVTIGATVGYFLPGKAYTSASRDTAAQAMVNMNVAF